MLSAFKQFKRDAGAGAAAFMQSPPDVLDGTAWARQAGDVGKCSLKYLEGRR